MRGLGPGARLLTAGIAASGLVLFAHGLVIQARRLALYHAHGIGVRDPGCGVSFCDSSVFWLAGRLARQGAVATIYRAPAFAHYGAAALPGHDLALPFVYPPMTLLPAALLSLPPLPAAYGAFTLVSILGFVLLLRRAGLGWAPILLGLLSPAAMWSIYLGQFGLPCGALLIAGLAQMDRRPAEAGTLLGLLAIKPQYALAAPVVVLAGRHWRAMAAGVLTLAVLAGLSLVCFGPRAWALFLGPGQAAARLLLVSPFQHGDPVLGVSIFWMLRSLGAAVAAAGWVQFALAIPALAAIAWLWRRPAANPPARLLATICLALLAIPYSYTDDLAALSTVLPLLWRRATPIANLILAGVWLSPALTGVFLSHIGFLPEPFFIASALGLALHHHRAADDLNRRGACIAL